METEPTEPNGKTDLDPSLSGEMAAAEARRRAARLLGQTRSLAKAQAARQNGRRGGRPRGTRLSAETRRKISRSKHLRKVEDAARP